MSRAQFIGGPHHGRIAEINGAPATLMVPIMPKLDAYWIVGPPYPDPEFIVRVGEYRRGLSWGDAYDYNYIGER